MKTNIETEYKCLINQQQFNDLIDFYSTTSKIFEQTNVYYQDLNGIIIQRKAVFRQRIMDNSSIITFKIKLNDQLHEYDFDTIDINDDEVTNHLQQFGIHPPFIKVGTLKTIRHQIDLGNADLCIDENHYNNIVDYEIEYEIKKQHDGTTILKHILIQHGIPFIENHVSKYQRCYSTTASGIIAK